MNKITKIICPLFVMAFAIYSLTWPLISLAMVDELFPERANATEHAFSILDIRSSVLISQVKIDSSFQPIKVCLLWKKFSHAFDKGDKVEHYIICNFLFNHNPFINCKYSLAAYTASG
ncbi:hypothetical protein A2V82_12715 [candidate division KSB1 bacterium RBG_16_48_16]|nr:MAG: hypothetical protein A2V82_12715 [candidate division KSB1 bacterium RBG_16_48_16]